MAEVFRKTEAPAVTSCDRWVRVCAADCRRLALRERAVMRQLWLRVRV